MASFTLAYNLYVAPAEGGYANVPGDRGGETYAGISRVFYPDLPLWKYIDSVKAKRPIRHNEKFPELQPQVNEFYNKLWNKHRLSEINNQFIAGIIFDYIVHSGTTAIKAVQQILGVKADGIIGPETINAINKQAPEILGQKILEQRRNFLISFANKPNQQQFLRGWLNRIDKLQNDLNKLIKSKSGSFGLLTIGIFVLILLKINNKI
jgi:lysozyme family protein